MMQKSARRACPLCGTLDPQVTIERPMLPIFQNVVYDTSASARLAPSAHFELGTCKGCGFSFNAAFEPDRVTYDADYDNHVESSAFRSYYRDIARMLIERFQLIEGTVYDVGCGKGEFLKVLCEMAPGITGIGVDPSCTPCREGNFILQRSTFESSEIAGDARLVILRHVLEHIDQPAHFLAKLKTAMPAAPLYVEVPDLRWILENGAFWDFCYEHCNYFTSETLTLALANAGFEIVGQDRSFGGQYQWIIGTPTGKPFNSHQEADEAKSAIDAYAAKEATAISALRDIAQSDRGVAIWGMATKGVLLSILLGEQRVIGGIDMNVGKQGRFAAGSGVSINSPEWLRTLRPGTRVLVMNPNYLSEITSLAQAIRNDLRIISV
jgi:hypothetical protein